MSDAAMENRGGTFGVASYAQLGSDADIARGPWRGIVSRFALLDDPRHPQSGLMLALLFLGEAR